MSKITHFRNPEPQENDQKTVVQKTIKNNGYATNVNVIPADRCSVRNYIKGIVYERYCRIGSIWPNQK